MVRIGLLGFLLDLVTGTGTRASTHGAADDGSRRPGHRTTDGGTAQGACRTTDSGAGFLIALGRFAGHCAAGRSQGSADGRTDRSADDAADHGTANCSCRAADGLATVLLVVRRGAFSKILVVAIVWVLVSGPVVHWMGSPMLSG